MNARTAPALLPCGCLDNKPHSDQCQLGLAEAVAQLACDAAPASGRNGLVAALQALVEYGLLRDLTDDDPEDLLEGILDMLWEAGLIRRDRA